MPRRTPVGSDTRALKARRAERSPAVAAASAAVARSSSSDEAIRKVRWGRRAMVIGGESSELDGTDIA